MGVMERILLLLLCLLLLLLLLPEVELRSTQAQGTFSTSAGFDNFTEPEYWSCCGYQRVPGSDPLAGLYRLYFGVPPQLLPECRDFCVYTKVGELDGSLYCFTYQDAIHHPVCEDPIPDSTTEPSSTSDDGF